MILVFITKHLFIYSSIIYGKNIVESTATSAIVSPSPGSGAGSGSKTDLAEVGFLSTTVLRLFKSDANGDPVEMKENTDFEKKKFNKADIYTFKENVNCTLVKCGNKEIWKKGDQGVNEPESVMYSPSLEIIGVRDAQRSVLYKKDDSGIWAPDAIDTTKQADGSGGTVTKSESTEASSTQADSDKENVKQLESYDHLMPIESPNFTLPTPDKFDILKYFIPGKTKHPIILNIGMKFNTLLFDYTKKDNLHTFDTKENFVFAGVAENMTIIWDSGGEKVYSNKVELTENNILTVYLTDGRTKVFEKEGNFWDRLSDEDSDFEEDEYHFSDEVDSAAIYCFGRRVWEYKEGDEYNAVRLNRVGGTLTLKNFNDDEEDLIETDLTDPDLTKPSVDIYTLGSEHPNDETKYHFILSSENEGHYIFRKNVKCKQVVMNGESIWNHYRSVYGATYPRAVSYYSSSEVNIHFHNYILVLNKKNMIWRRSIDMNGQTYSSPYKRKRKKTVKDVPPETEPESELEPEPSPIPVELDITIEGPTKEIIYGKFDDAVVFMLKEGCGFKVVKDDEALIWNTEDPKNYATQVENNRENNTVNIRFENGFTKMFKGIDGKWTEDNVDSTDAMKKAQNIDDDKSIKTSPPPSPIETDTSESEPVTTSESSPDQDVVSSTTLESTPAEQDEGTATTPTTHESTTPAETSSGTTILESTQPDQDVVSVTTPESTTQPEQDSCQSSGEVTSATTTPSASSTPSKVKLFKTDTSGKPVEMVEGTDFEKNKVAIYRYEFKANVNCTSVKFGDKEKWKKEEHGVKEPRYLLHFVKLGEIILFGDPGSDTDANDSGMTTGETGTVANEGTTPTSVDPSMTPTTPSSGNSGLTGSAPSTPVTGPKSVSGTGTGGSGGGTASPTTVLKLYKDDGSGNPVEMVENTDFEKKNVSIDKYVFKQNIKCTLVKLGQKEIWKEGERGVYEPKYVLHFVKSVEIILFEDPDSGSEATDSGVTTGAHVKSADGSAGSSSTAAKSGSSGSKTGVELSLKAKKATDQFDHNKSGKIVTFTAKGDHGFKSVKSGDKAVWSTTNTNEYATKVVLEGKGQKNKKVTIHLPNNTTKVFNREGKGKPWNEVAQPGKDTGKVATTPGGGPSGHSAGQGGGAVSTPTATTGGGTTTN